MKSFQINKNFNYFKFGFIANFQLVPFKNKLLSLVYFANGALAYFVSTQFHRLFRLFFRKQKSESWYFDYLRSYDFARLIQINRIVLVCMIELAPGFGAQYCRSAGATGKIIKFDRNAHSVLIYLPSGAKKMFSEQSFVVRGMVAFKVHRKMLNSKAGY